MTSASLVWFVVLSISQVIEFPRIWITGNVKSAIKYQTIFPLGLKIVDKYSVSFTLLEKIKETINAGIIALIHALVISIAKLS